MLHTKCVPSPAYQPLQVVFLCALPPLPAVAYTGSRQEMQGRRLARENSNTPQLVYIMIFKVLLCIFNRNLCAQARDVVDAISG